VLPVVVVELAAYCNEDDQQTYPTWCDTNSTKLESPDFHLPAMRVAQAAALKVPGAYLESAMDLGSIHPANDDRYSVHPLDKLVGRAMCGRGAFWSSVSCH
jgi:hypothetical protein